MNFASKRTLIKSSFVFLIILIICSFISLVTNVFFSENTILIYKLLNLSEDKINLYLILNIVFDTIHTICYILLAFYVYKKSTQTKEEFYAKTTLYKVMSIIAIPLTFIPGILMTVSAFKKDDGQDEIIDEIAIKTKENIIKIPVYYKKIINQLKRDRRLGIISEELYEKKLNTLKKESLNK